MFWITIIEYKHHLYVKSSSHMHSPVILSRLWSQRVKYINKFKITILSTTGNDSRIGTVTPLSQQYSQPVRVWFLFTNLCNMFRVSFFSIFSSPIMNVFFFADLLCLVLYLLFISFFLYLNRYDQRKIFSWQLYSSVCFGRAMWKLQKKVIQKNCICTTTFLFSHQTGAFAFALKIILLRKKQYFVCNKTETFMCANIYHR